MSAAIEDMLRNHLQRQKDIHRRSLKAVADMAAANNEMILMNGLATVWSRRDARAMLMGESNHATEGVDGKDIG